jgi:drug/metabolite transporter (DMT)-like permease
VSSTAAGALLALASASCYSAMYFLVRAGVRRADLDGGAFVTTVVNATLLAGGTVVVAVVGGAPNWNLTAVFWFAVAGVLGTFGGRVLMMAGLRRIGPVRTASIANTAPILTITISVLILGERLSSGAVVAAGMVLVGLGVLALDAFGISDPVLSPAVMGPGAGTTSRRTSPAVVGLGLSVLSALTFGVGRATRRVGIDYMPDPLVGAMIGAVAALIFQLALQVSQRRIRSVVLGAFRDIRPALWLGGVASTLGLLTFFAAIQLAPLSYVAVVASSETMITMIVSWVLFRRRDALSTRVVFAAILVFGASVLVTIS